MFDVPVHPATGRDLQVHDTHREQGHDVLFRQSNCQASLNDLGIDLKFTPASM